MNFKDKPSVWEIVKLFTRLGFTSFGGPAAHNALMEHEIVSKREWVDRQHFLDLIGITSLIPGPNSTELAMLCGFHRAGLAGLLAAGFCFIFPAVVITGTLAYFYLHYGNLPEIKPFLYGIKPAVIVIVLNAVYKLGSKAVKGWKLFSIGAAVAVINFMGVNEIYSILAGGLIGSFFIYLTEKKGTININFLLPFWGVFSAAYFLQNSQKVEVSLTKLFLVFLKIGAVLFGSGYVLVAYLDGELVRGLNWITRQELLDAIAVGQFTPGPVLSTVTFIGYQIAGISGALIATAGIFLPSFIFVLIINPFVPKLRRSKIFSLFLDAVNISALAVMLVIGIKLGAEVLIDWRAILIAILAGAAFLIIKKINSAYIVIGGALLGYLLSLL
ncbi:MAG TPA: chromate efflux transporter [Ignavibacteriaceae bacterium]|nr:chromate efflux transporter [Ignavibacteriaceae bacterium]